jgi:hypothetical protein
MDIFRTVIFLMHFLTACVLTFGVWLRCGQDPFSYHMMADSHTCQAGSNCTAPYISSSATFNTTCYTKPSGDDQCSNQGLPLYDRSSTTIGWHLFAILAHFEWVSAAFAFYYIRSRYQPYAWLVSICITFVGTLLCMPWTTDVFWNEILLFWATFLGCSGIFYTFHDVVPDSVYSSSRMHAETAALLFPKMTRDKKRSISTEYMSLQGACDKGCPVPVIYTEEPALRLLEYSLTGSELFIAVLNIFIPDAPAFFTLLGYCLVFCCNLCGVLVHYSMIMMNDKSAVEIPPPEDSLRPIAPPVGAGARSFNLTGFVVYPPQPRSWWYPSTWVCVPSWGHWMGSHAGLSGFWSAEPGAPVGGHTEEMCRVGWGTTHSLRLSCLMHSWTVYIIALSFLFYQGNLLYSSTAPAFVVASGWLLVLTYSSFGLWATAAWYFPSVLRWRIMGTCFGCSSHHETDVDAVFTRGLDVLSLTAKLSIVYNLSFGFIFMGGGVC